MSVDVLETWKKGEVVKDMRAFEDKDWYYDFMDNGTFSLPTTRFHLINTGWKKILPQGTLKFNNIKTEE